MEGTNFSLNDKEFEQIKKLSEEVQPKDLLIFWQFSLKVLDELNIVLNQNLFIIEKNSIIKLN